MNYGIIYLASNRVNGKVYVGQTTRALTVRIAQHLNDNRNTVFSAAIKKYGKKSFKWEIIDRAISQEELDSKEVQWIAFFRSNSKPSGYNLHSGGRGHGVADSTKQKLREKQMGRKYGRETREKISAIWKGRKRGPQSKEHRRKLSESKLRKERKDRKPVINLDTSKIYAGVRQASVECGTFPSTISWCCQGKRKTAGGYHWAYLSPPSRFHPSVEAISREQTVVV